MGERDIRDTWSAPCHPPKPPPFSKSYCCCCYRDSHHQHQIEAERLRAENAALSLVCAEQRAACLEDGGGNGVSHCLLCDWYVSPSNPDLTHNPTCILAAPQPEAVARAAELLATADRMATDVSEMLAGGIEMKPTTDGSVTFEAMLMLLQMLTLHRDEYRRLRGGRGEA